MAFSVDVAIAPACLAWVVMGNYEKIIGYITGPRLSPQLVWLSWLYGMTAHAGSNLSGCPENRIINSGTKPIRVLLQDTRMANWVVSIAYCMSFLTDSRCLAGSQVEQRHNQLDIYKY